MMRTGEYDFVSRFSAAESHDLVDPSTGLAIKRGRITVLSHLRLSRTLTSSVISSTLLGD
jgi:hypothetical protein